MSKLSRYTQYVFGSTAGSTQIGQFGSFAAGSALYTNNPGVIQQLGNYLQGWYGAVVGENSPAIQDLNALDFLYSYQLAYILQEGMPEYDGSTVYYIGCLCHYGSTLYQAVQDGFSGQTPSPTSTYWQTLVSNQLTTLGGMLYAGASGSSTIPTQLSGNTTASTAYLTQTGTGSASAAPIWYTPFYGITNSSEAFTTGSTTDQQVSNLVQDYTGNGNRPVIICLINDGSSSDFLGVNANSSAPVSAYFSFYRDGSLIAKTFLLAPDNDTQVQVPVSSFSFFDLPSAGSHQYAVKASTNTGGTAYVNAAKLLVYEP